jgi:hypothetical protein
MWPLVLTACCASCALCLSVADSVRATPVQERVLVCLTDPSVDALHALGPEAEGLKEEQLQQLLALRGLLACDLLLHGLQRRHLVEYGRNRWAASRWPGAQAQAQLQRHTELHSSRGLQGCAGPLVQLCCYAARRSPSARKRLAIPFRAADVPAERAEYAQPDVALLLTHLAHYYTGLSERELQAALQVLLRMGESAQRDFFEGWLALARGAVDEGGQPPWHLQPAACSDQAAGRS